MDEIVKSGNPTGTKNIIDQPIPVLIMAILSIILGFIFVFVVGSNEPISRGDAISCSGSFAKYESSDKYCTIWFLDGSIYEVYPHTETREFREKMKSLEQGTKLHLLINPNNDYVVEIKTEKEELLNFEISQREIDEYDNGYVVLGVVCWVASAYLILYTIGSMRFRRREAQRDAERKYGSKGALRDAADMSNGKILLDAKVSGYEICYRRLKLVNELIVNGIVYDEMKSFIEFEHRLCANVSGHEIEAGFDSDSNSYIMFDGKVIKHKKRII